MNRVDLALGYDDIYWGDEADAEWIASHGRKLRRQARLSASDRLRHQATPIVTRVQGWRRYGRPRGMQFHAWSPWLTETLRRAA